jgi:hypothetical protein
MVAQNTIFWPWLTIGPVVRPSRLTPWDQKGEAYDDNCATYYLGSIWQPYRNFYLQEYAANLNLAYNGVSSWGSDQVVREFLGDENNPTGRMAWKYAVFQPMHTRLVGAGDGVSVSAKATSWSSNLQTRKEAALYDRLLKSQLAQMGEPLDAAMAAQGVSPDERREEELHENLWTDPYEKAVTNLITAMGKRQNLSRKQRKVASNIALSGVAAIHQFINGNNIEAEVCEPHEVGWDTTAIRPDFSDGEFVYHSRLMDVDAIAEQFQPSKDKIKALDKWANMQSAMFSTMQNPGWPQRKPRVFTVYYKDMQYVERGFVLKDGEPHYCTINMPDPSRKDGKPEYTDNDLIPPPENEWTVTWTDQEWKQKKQVKAVERLRYCTMIPWQYLPGAYTNNQPFLKRAQTLDPSDLAHVSLTGNMVLESGEYPLQESDPDDKYMVEFPIKFASWMYMGGNAIAPLSCVRDIQGMMNATLSDMLMRMSRAEMPTTVFDHDALAAAGITAAEAVRNLKQGRSFSVKSMLVGGVNQAIKTTETGLGPEFYQRFNIIDKLYQMAQNSTGIYDQNFGAPGGEDQLVRVKEMQSRQSGVMLRPFIAAIQDLFEQVHQANAQAGKKFYAARPWALNQMVGNEGERMLIESKEMTNEQFRVETVLTMDAEQRKQDADNMILMQGGYMDRGLLDAKSAADLLGRSLPEAVNEGARQFTRRMAEAQKAMAEQQQQQQQAMMAAQQQANLEQQEMELSKLSVDTAMKQEAMERKSAQPIIQAAARHLEPNEQEALEPLNA